MPANNTPFKVLHILDHSLPLHSGYAFRSRDILRAQLKRGWQLAVLTSPKHAASRTKLWCEKETVGEIPHYRTKFSGRHLFPLGMECGFMVALARRILEVAEIEKPALLHAHSPILNALPALWAGRRLGIPVVYEIRAFWEDAAVARGAYKRNSWRDKLVRSLESWVCRKADQVTVICRGLRDDLAKRGIPDEKMAIVFNGINSADFTAREPDAECLRDWGLSGKKVIGFIGSFFRYEGLDLLLEAFARLSAARADVILLLVGGGEMEAELKAQAKRLGIEKRVVIPGRIPHSRIPGVYALVDVLVYPRHSMRLTELVTPLKPLEAMAMGKALVASDVGGHRELIRHGRTGILFPAGDASALVEALGRLLDDPGLRQSLERQGYTWVRKEHSWDKTTAVYADIYGRALARPLSSCIAGEATPVTFERG